jgi:hypothetical protein
MKPENWTTLLLQSIEARRTAPFEWGTNDCVKFVYNVTHDVNGVDWLNGLSWSTAREAAEMLAEKDIVERANEWFGAQIHPNYATMGDVVAVKVAGRTSLAICIGTEAMGAGETCAVKVPMSLATHAWRGLGD